MTNFLVSTAQELKQKRLSAGIPGRLICGRAGIDRSRLSDIERGYVEPSEAELARLNQALDELTDAKRKLATAAAACGWPVSAL
jgi:transcriptional regulator with XRE-family HTH domain